MGFYGFIAMNAAAHALYEVQPEERSLLGRQAGHGRTQRIGDLRPIHRLQVLHVGVVAAGGRAGERIRIVGVESARRPSLLAAQG
jgi:hypothetical protein